MPEFENLEPFLDQSGETILPVAPHSTAAHDFILQRRETRPTKPGQKASAAPEPAEVKDVPRHTTSEMEKAYRNAIKASRARRKAHDKRQGKTIWKRLFSALSGLFGKRQKESPSARRSGAPSDTSGRRRSGGRGSARPEGRGRGRGRGRPDGKDDTESGKTPSGNRPRQRSRSRGRGGKGNNSNASSPQVNAQPRGNRKRDNQRKDGAASPPKDSSDKSGQASTNSGRSRRRRSKRNRPSSSNPPSKAPKSSE